MWDRKELKARGKAAFQANYWRCVLVALLVVFVIGSGGAACKEGADKGRESYSSGSAQTVQGTDALEDAFNALPPDVREEIRSESIDQLPPEILSLLQGSKTQVPPLLSGIVLMAIIGAVAVAALIFAVIDALLLNPLEVGCRRFFLVNGGAPATLNEVIFGYENRYWNVVKTILLRDIYIFLWSLLLVIPGIVKGYSYRLVPYVLADDPGVTPAQAIDISRSLMKGQKWRAFVLDLSFLGWNFLAALTAGLVGVFYAFPYECATDAELYRVLRDTSGAAYD